MKLPYRQLELSMIIISFSMIVDMHIFFHPNFDNALHSSFIHRQSLTKFVLRFTSTISQLKVFFFKDAYKIKPISMCMKSY